MKKRTRRTRLPLIIMHHPSFSSFPSSSSTILLVVLFIHHSSFIIGPSFIIPVCGVLIVVCAHCTPEQRYRTLSFFFDGVPDPSKVSSTTKPVEQDDDETGPRVAPKPIKPVSFHTAYIEGKCESCHAGARLGMQAMPESKVLCAKCHTTFGKGWTSWHGPTAAWACTECHTGHESPHKALLHKPVPELCAKCHDLEAPSFAASNDAHATKQDCALCHDPHGSANALLLKD